MIIQISSGRGPVECEIAVKNLYESLCAEFKNINLITYKESRNGEGWTSCILESEDEDLSPLLGTVQWICSSSIRPDHKRKNWFIDVSEIKKSKNIATEIKEGDIVYEAFRSSGKGGQHVNKTNSAVRAYYNPANITVVSSKERSQHMNKMDCIHKIQSILKHINASYKDISNNEAWIKHNNLIRGNPVRIYVGKEFKIKE